MKRHALKNIGIGILVFVLFYFGYLFQLIPVILFDINLEKISPTGEMLLSLFSSLCIILIFIGIYKDQFIREWQNFKENLKDNMVTGLKYWAIGFLCMAVFSYLIENILGISEAANQVAVESIIKKVPLLMLVDAGIVSPFVEEVVFRKTVVNIFRNKWVVAIISGLLFGLAHVVGQTQTLADWLHVLPYGSLGFFFALAYVETDSIYTSYIFHMIHNIPQILMIILL